MHVNQSWLRQLIPSAGAQQTKSLLLLEHQSVTPTLLMGRHLQRYQQALRFRPSMAGIQLLLLLGLARSVLLLLRCCGGRPKHTTGVMTRAIQAAGSHLQWLQGPPEWAGKCTAT